MKLSLAAGASDASEKSYSRILLGGLLLAILPALFVAPSVFAAEDALTGAWNSTRFDPENKELDSYLFIFKKDGTFSVLATLGKGESKVKFALNGKYTLTGENLMLEIEGAKRPHKISFTGEELCIVDLEMKSKVFFKKEAMK